MFEYAFVTNDDRDELLENLNKLGGEGFEAVSMQVVNNKMVVLMKRGIPHKEHFEASPKALEAMLNASMGR